MLVQSLCFFDNSSCTENYTGRGVSKEFEPEIFPSVSEETKKQFPLEINLLKREWKSCVQRLKNNPSSETIEDILYPGDTCADAAVTATLYGIGGCLLGNMANMNAYRAPVKRAPFGQSPSSLSILNMAEMHQLELERNADDTTISKIKGCVKWLNLLVEFSELSHSLKMDVSREKLSELFNIFGKIQRKESKLTAKKISEIESLFLMDNLCKMVISDFTWCDLIVDWKWKVEGEMDLKLNFSPLDLSEVAYKQFLDERKFRDSVKLEKIITAKKYIKDEFILKSYPME